MGLRVLPMTTLHAAKAAWATVCVRSARCRTQSRQCSTRSKRWPR